MKKLVIMFMIVCASFCIANAQEQVQDQQVLAVQKQERKHKFGLKFKRDKVKKQEKLQTQEPAQKKTKKWKIKALKEQKVRQEQMQAQKSIEKEVKKPRFKRVKVQKEEKEQLQIQGSVEKKVKEQKPKRKKVQKPKQVDVHVIKHEKEYPIDIAMCECLEKSAKTRDIRRCADVSARAWEKEIKKEENVLKVTLPSTQYRMFNSSQKLWKKYYKAQRKLIIKTIRQKDGKIDVNNANTLINELVRQRAVDINRYHSMVNVEE